MSAAITFQVAREVEQRLLQPRELLRPEEVGFGAVLRLLVLAVRAPVGAHVEHEHVDQRA